MKIRDIESGIIKPSDPPSDEDLAKQAKTFNELWEEFELQKMDVTPGSKWYLISAEWLKKYKEYIMQPSDGTGDVKMDIEYPGMILNEDILEEPENLVEDNTQEYLNYNLKENLIEETNYYIVNQKVWDFLFSNYGGLEICRLGIKRQDSEECIIEANLIKLNIHYFPNQSDEESVHLYTIYESRYTTLEELRERLARIKGKQKHHVRLWKTPIPSDFDKFYRDNLCEFRKHRKIRLNSERLKENDKIINDMEITMDDFIIVE